MTTDARGLYRAALGRFGDHVHGVAADQWHLPTPCQDWDVRMLVNHVVGENRWVVPLFDGKTVTDVGNRLDGDLLGDDPLDAWDDSAAAALAVIDDASAMDGIVHLSFGDFPGSEYALQLFADLLIHGWDLATATGQPARLDAELVVACAAWFGPMQDAYRGAGAVGPRPEVADDADAQTVLLADFGRTATGRS